MNRNLLAFLAGWVALGLAVANAPAAVGAGSAATVPQSGTITGRVKNVATGQYLNNARVSIRGSDLTAQTDQFGVFRIVGAPSGTAVLEVFYTGLDPWSTPVAIPAGGSVEQDVELTNVARYGQVSNTVKLDAFVVTDNAETDAGAIAINEQRFSPNIKNVISTEALGDVLGGSVGEFLKFQPGITMEHAGNEITGLSIRGIGGGMTSFTTDGAPMVFASYAGPDRAFNMYTQDLNDASRIEITKVPTPSTPADSLAGSINMISKSAFDRDRAQFRFGISLVGNHENLTLRKTPDSFGDRNTYKVIPGVNFDYTAPITKTFGIVVTGLHITKTGEIHQSLMTYENGGTATGASPARPYLRQHALNDGPRRLTRANFSFKADWKITPKSVLSLSVQWNEHETVIGTLNRTINAGNNGTSIPAGGTPLSYGENFTTGATGRGAVTYSTTFQTFGGGAISPTLNYRFDDGRWQIESSASLSKSKISRDDVGNGHFLTLSATINSPLRVSFSDINNVRPGTIRTFGNNNQEINFDDIANFRVTGAAENFYDRRVTSENASLKVKRRLEYFPFPSAVEIGGAHRIQSFDGVGYAQNWTYAGPDGNVATIEPAAPYLMQVYVNQNSYFGFRNIPWLSPDRALDAFRKNPVLFTQTPAQVVAQETSRITSSQYIREKVSAIYGQADATLLSGRVRVLGGARFEKTTDQGEGPLFDPNAVFIRNADGSFARNAQGARIRKAEAGAAGSLDELRLIRKERAYKANQSYDGVYPSAHVTYEIRENLLLRAAYAMTYGRPNFGNIIPTATINESDIDDQDVAADPGIVRGNITLTNTGLRPWTANNYDLSLEYYTKTGGLLSAGLFRKDIDDFFATDQRIATAADVRELGLDDRYVGWRVSSMFNSGNARISGAEVNLRQSLGFLGPWGAPFSVFANGTKLQLEGHQQASFTSFIPKSANWGVSFNKRRFSAMAKWNYRGLDRRVPNVLFGPDGYQYFKERTTLDLTIGYRLTQRLSLAASVNNVFYEPTQTYLDYGSQTPGYARQSRVFENGIPVAVTLRGTF